MTVPTTPDTQGPPRPDLDAGLKYWNAVAQKDVSNNAVLGGFGLGVSCFLALLCTPLFFILDSVWHLVSLASWRAIFIAVWLAEPLERLNIIPFFFFGCVNR